MRTCAAARIGQNPQIMRRLWQGADRTVPYILLQFSLLSAVAGGARSGSVHQAQQLVDSQRQDPEHQVA